MATQIDLIKAGVRITTLLPRSRVREVACPECNASPGNYCVRPNRERRVSNHLDRVWDALEHFGLVESL